VEVLNNDQPLSDYVKTLNDNLRIICENSQKHLEAYNESNIARRNRTDKDAKHIFNIGDYALVTYPNRPPHKLAPRYRGPMVIVDQKHPDIFVCRDVITEKDISVHVDRLLEFRHDKPPTDDFVALAAADHDEFAVEAIADHVGSGKKPATYDFKIRWSVMILREILGSLGVKLRI
jgi:hypothetical protein